MADAITVDDSLTSSLYSHFLACPFSVSVHHVVVVAVYLLPSAMIEHLAVLLSVDTLHGVYSDISPLSPMSSEDRRSSEGS